jgi:hypothetical protein
MHRVIFPPALKLVIWLRRYSVEAGRGRHNHGWISVPSHKIKLEISFPTVLCDLRRTSPSSPLSVRVSLSSLQPQPTRILLSSFPAKSPTKKTVHHRALCRLPALHMSRSESAAVEGSELEIGKSWQAMRYKIPSESRHSLTHHHLIFRSPRLLAYCCAGANHSGNAPHKPSHTIPTPGINSLDCNVESRSRFQTSLYS